MICALVIKPPNSLLGEKASSNARLFVLKLSSEPIGLPALLYARNKISVITNISIFGFYENIGNIEKYRWIF